MNERKRTPTRGNQTPFRARRQAAEPNRRSVAANLGFHPARGLMICLGWLRLFQAIVSDGVPAARRRFAHETEYRRARGQSGVQFLLAREESNFTATAHHPMANALVDKENHRGSAALGPERRLKTRSMRQEDSHAE